MNDKNRRTLWDFIVTVLTAAVTALASVFGINAM